MDIKRQIEFDEKHLSDLDIAINETRQRFNDTMELINKLNVRLCELSADKKDYEIRIAIRKKMIQV